MSLLIRINGLSLAFDINAYYNLESNSINFPAGILWLHLWQEPKYWKELWWYRCRDWTWNYPCLWLQWCWLWCENGDSIIGDKADSKSLTRGSKPLKISGMVWKFTGLRWMENSQSLRMSQMLRVFHPHPSAQTDDKTNPKDYLRTTQIFGNKRLATVHNILIYKTSTHQMSYVLTNKLKNLPEFYEAHLK